MNNYTAGMPEGVPAVPFHGPVVILTASIFIYTGLAMAVAGY